MKKSHKTTSVLQQLALQADIAGLLMHNLKILNQSSRTRDASMGMSSIPIMAKNDHITHSAAVQVQLKIWGCFVVFICHWKKS